MRNKKPTKQIVHDANDVLESGNIPSSMGETVDEPKDRYMEYSGLRRPGDKVNTVNCYRIDDMYEAIDY